MRTRLPLPFATQLKRVMPRSLLGRTLLIMLVPLVLVQAIALQMFYGNHLEVVSRRMSSAIAGEIFYTVELLHQFQSPSDREWVLQMARDEFTLGIRLEPGAVLESHK
jgi:two-component system osmolarity sensor histidine kinase EnvZ